MNPEIFVLRYPRPLWEDFEPGDFYTIAQAYARVVQPRTVCWATTCGQLPELWHRRRGAD